VAFGFGMSDLSCDWMCGLSDCRMQSKNGGNRYEIFGLKRERGAILLGRFSAKYNPNEKRRTDHCNPKMIMSCLAKIEMSSFKVLRCLFLRGRHHGSRGHHYGDSGGT
jgi:hypothetical protein